MRASSDFVRYDGLRDMWGHVPDAAATELEMGRRHPPTRPTGLGPKAARVRITRRILEDSRRPPVTR
jgi:hypothetical protein